MDLRFDRNRVKVLHGVFAEEVESNLVFLLKSNVFNTQRAAADCISLIFTLLIAHTQSQFINQVGADTEHIILLAL